jgi:hypothetical protein
MEIAGSSTYFDTQAAALNFVFANVKDRGYNTMLPDNLWTEHVGYGQTVKYHFPLTVNRTGNPARKWLHITLYRMDSGSYELTSYLY